MKQLKNIVFDMGGVLINLDMKAGIEGFRKMGFSNIDEFINRYAQNGMFSDLEKGLISANDFQRLIEEQVGHPIDTNELLQVSYSCLLDIPQKKLDQIDQIAKNYRVFLLSNTNEVHYPYIDEKFHLTPHFEKCYLSHQVHIAKPDPAIFDYVIQDAQILPEETLFIDDSAKNIEVAKSKGWNTYLAHENEDFTQLFLSLHLL